MQPVPQEPDKSREVLVSANAFGSALMRAYNGETPQLPTRLIYSEELIVMHIGLLLFEWLFFSGYAIWIGAFEYLLNILKTKDILFDLIAVILPLFLFFLAQAWSLVRVYLLFFRDAEWLILDEEGFSVREGFFFSRSTYAWRDIAHFRAKFYDFGYSTVRIVLFRLKAGAKSGKKRTSLMQNERNFTVESCRHQLSAHHNLYCVQCPKSRIGSLNWLVTQGCSAKY